MRTRTTAAAGAVIGLLALGACGTAATQSGGSDSTATGSVPQEQPQGAALDGYAANIAADSLVKDAGRGAAQPLVIKRSLIHTGEVDLRSHDVARAAAGVRAVARRYAGRIDDERAQARHGVLSDDVLTLRVPSGHFAAAMAAIKGLGSLRSATSSADDVTTQVIDVKVRLQAQRSSLRRIEQLMRRAQTLGQVIALEGQLTQRQAALNALEQKQAYLRDQTSLSTITVVVSRIRTPAATTTRHRTGFLGGLHHGWHALVVSATAVAAGVGAALPFGVPLLVLGVPVWLALRRRRGTAPASPPEVS